MENKTYFSWKNIIGYSDKINNYKVSHSRMKIYNNTKFRETNN